MYLSRRFASIVLEVMWFAAAFGLILGKPQSGGAVQGKNSPQATAGQKTRLEERDRLKASAKQLDAQQKLGDAVAAIQQAISIEREIFGGSSEQVASSLEDLAGLQIRQDDFPAVIKTRQEVLSIQKQLHGGAHWKVIDARQNLAEAEQLAEMDQEHRRLLTEAIQIASRIQQLYQKGLYKEAIPLAQRGLEIRKEISGETHPEYAAFLNKLAALYGQMGDYRQAATLLQQALEIYKTTLGEKHPNYAKSLQNLATMYSLMGDNARAEPLSRQALEIRKEILGEKHPDYASSVYALAWLYKNMGDYKRAEPLDKEALEIRKETLGEKHPDYASNLSDLGWVYQSMGDYRRAEPLLRQALEIYKEALGEKHPYHARGLNNLAVMYYKMGDYKQAEPFYLQALAVRKETLGEKHPDYVASLSNLAGLYAAMGDYTKAESLNRQALDVRKEKLGEKHPDYADSLSQLAWVYDATGDYNRAESLFLQAMQIKKQALGEKHNQYANCLDNLAVLYDRMGDYSRAEPLYLQALKILKESLGERHPDYAGVLNNLAALYEQKGDYTRAEPLYRQALEINKEALGEKHPSYAVQVFNFAALYHLTGDYSRAEPLYRQAMEIWKEALGEKHPRYAMSLYNLGHLYRLMGEYSRAEPLFQQALEIRKETLGEKHPECAATLNNLARLYHATGDYNRAEPLFRQALEIWKGTVGEKHPEYGRGLESLAALYEQMGDRSRAESLYRQALEILKEALGEMHLDYAETLNHMAGLYDDMGEYNRAEPLSYQAVQIVRQRLDRTAAVQSERQQLAMTAVLRSYLDTYLSIPRPAVMSKDPLYQEMLSWKGAVSARQQLARLMRRETQTPTVARLYQQLEIASHKLANQAMATPAMGKEGDYRKGLTQLSDEIEKLERELSSASEDFRKQMDLRRIMVDDLKRCLPEDAVLVDLLEYEKRTKDKKERSLVAFVVRRGKPVERVELGSVAPIAAAIDDWRESLGRSEAPATMLRRLLWKPLESYVTGAKTLLISPDGAVARFPWTAMPGKQPGTYLLEEMAAAEVPIPRQLPELLASKQKTSTQPHSLLLIGDVSFGAMPGKPEAEAPARSAPRRSSGGTMPEWEPLPATRAEIASIKDSFERAFPDARDRAKDLREDIATEQEVRDEVPKYRFIHFATHGYFAPRDLVSALSTASRTQSGGDSDMLSRQDIAGFHPGLLSGLVLTGANQPPEPDRDDGILTALEVAELDLGGVELATLSACDTGLGETAGGEGLLGLQRAFQSAGAHSVVASLWKIRDDAARSLMVDFYQNLWRKGMSKIEALRAAQLTMLRDGIRRGIVPADRPKEARRLPPEYWAAFVLSGDWR